MKLFMKIFQASFQILHKKAESNSQRVALYPLLNFSAKNGV